MIAAPDEGARFRQRLVEAAEHGKNADGVKGEMVVVAQHAVPPGEILPPGDQLRGAFRLAGAQRVFQQQRFELADAFAVPVQPIVCQHFFQMVEQLGRVAVRGVRTVAEQVGEHLQVGNGRGCGHRGLLEIWIGEWRGR